MKACKIQYQFPANPRKALLRPLQLATHSPQQPHPAPPPLPRQKAFSNLINTKERPKKADVHDEIKSKSPASGFRKKIKSQRTLKKVTANPTKKKVNKKQKQIKTVKKKEQALSVRLRNYKLFSPRKNNQQQKPPWGSNRSKSPVSHDEESQLLHKIKSKIQSYKKKLKRCRSAQSPRKHSLTPPKCPFPMFPQISQTVSQYCSKRAEQRSVDEGPSEQQRKLRMQLFEKHALKEIITIQRYYRKRLAKRKRVADVIARKLIPAKGIIRQVQTEMQICSDKGMVTDCFSRTSTAQTQDQLILREQHQVQYKEIEEQYGQVLAQLENELKSVRAQLQSSKSQEQDKQSLRKILDELVEKRTVPTTRRLQVEQIKNRLEEMLQISYIYQKPEGFPTNLHVLNEFQICLWKFINQTYLSQFADAINFPRGQSFSELLDDIRGRKDSYFDDQNKDVLNQQLFHSFEANAIQPPQNEQERYVKRLQSFHNKVIFQAVNQQLLLMRPALFGSSKVRNYESIFYKAKDKVVQFGSILAGLLLQNQKSNYKLNNWEQVQKVPVQGEELRRERRQRGDRQLMSWEKSREWECQLGLESKWRVQLQLQVGEAVLETCMQEVAEFLRR